MKLNLKSFQGDVKLLKDGTYAITALQDENFFVGKCGTVTADKKTVSWTPEFMTFVKVLFARERELWIKENPSVITKRQVDKFSVDIPDGQLDIEIRYDDECGNRHNSFAITGSEYDRRDRIPYESCKDTHVGRRWFGCGGCMHDEILEVVKNNPMELSEDTVKKAVLYHLMSSDSPMYYLENTLYHAEAHPPVNGYLYFEDKNIKGSRSCLKAGTVVEMEKLAVPDPKYSVEVDEESYKLFSLKGVQYCGMWPELTSDDIDVLFPLKLLNRYWGIMEEFKKMITQDLKMRW